MISMQTYNFFFLLVYTNYAIKLKRNICSFSVHGQKYLSSCMIVVKINLTHKVCLANKYKMVNAIIPSPPAPFSNQPIPTPKMTHKGCREGQLMPCDHIVLTLDGQLITEESEDWDSSGSSGSQF